MYHVVCCPRIPILGNYKEEKKYYLMCLMVVAKDQPNKLVAINVQINVVVIPNPSIKNFANIKDVAPSAVETIARVDKTVPRSMDFMLWCINVLYCKLFNTRIAGAMAIIAQAIYTSVILCVCVANNPIIIPIMIVPIVIREV